MKTWEIRAKLTDKADLISLLLKNRGLVSHPDQQEFLQPSPPQQLTPKQVGISIEEVAAAKRRLNQAKQKGEVVVVYGDYDADGICATAILWEALYDLGINVLPFVPSREDHGYGLSIKGLKTLLAQPQPQLVITVDNGIVAHAAVDYAQSQAIDVIVTDHHQLGQNLPPAEAIIHTTQLAGAGVAWMLAKELNPKAAKRSLDLAALGTVADMMPLLGPNRHIVVHGLKQLRQTQRLGFKALFEEAGVVPETIDTYAINFVIAPRLNATGRVREALDAVRLVCTKDDQRAKLLAQILATTNRDRQTLLETQLAHAKARVKTEEKILIVEHASYHQGIIGLIAGKLTEEFYRPSIVLSLKQGIAKASARSIPGFDIIGAIRQTEDLVLEAGGHPMAAGFSVAQDKLGQLRQRLQQIAQEKITDAMLQPKITIEAEIEPKDLSLELYQMIGELEPFGIANPRPIFCLTHIPITQAKLVGNDNQHLKLKLQPLPQVDAMGFNLGRRFPKISPGQKFDLAFTLTENQWNNHTSLQLNLKDLKPSQ